MISEKTFKAALPFQSNYSFLPTGCVKTAQQSERIAPVYQSHNFLSIEIEDKTLKPVSWIVHPSQPNVMLCGAEAGYQAKKSTCFALDLGHGGKVANKYTGE